MKLTTWICALAVSAVGLSAAPAFGSGFTLDLSAPSSVVVGKPALLRATGTIPPQDIEFPYWFSLDAIPTSVTTTCPTDSFEGAQIAQGTGGAIVVLTQREIPDAAGNFSIPVGVRPSAPGPVLLCGYTDDGAATTLATASLVLRIQAAPEHHATARARARCRRIHSRKRRARCLRALHP